LDPVILLILIPVRFGSVDTSGFEVFLVGMSDMVPHFSFALLVLIF